MPFNLLSLPEIAGKGVVAVVGGLFPSGLQTWCPLLAVPTAILADSFIRKILLRLSGAKDSTCMTNRVQNTSIVSTMWLMVGIIPQAGRAGERAEAVNLVPGGS